MTKSKKKKILMISFCIIFIVVSIAMGAIKANTLHTKHCHVPNCNLCNLIDTLKDFEKNIMLIHLEIFILAIQVPLIALIKSFIYKNQNLTLVKLKVLQNK